MAGSDILYLLSLLMRHIARQRPGTTLIELVMFLAFFATISGIMVTILVRTSETRIRQQVIADVDLTGVQMIQTVARNIRRAERILSPAIGASGSILALQMGDTEKNPTILAVQSGVLIIAEYETSYTLSPETIVVSDFFVHNTSPTDSRQSVIVSFVLSRSAHGVQFAYQSRFEAAVTLFPDDVLQGDQCGCALPTCTAGTYAWNVCEQDVCRAAQLSLTCL